MPNLKPESLKVAVYAAINWEGMDPAEAIDIKDVLSLAYIFYQKVYAANPETFQSAEALRRIAVALGAVFKDGAALGSGQSVAIATPKGVVLIE